MKPWQVLLAVVVPLYLLFKAVALVRCGAGLGPGRLAGYLLWPGMDPRPFTGVVRRSSGWLAQGLAVMTVGLLAWSALWWASAGLDDRAVGWLGIAVILTTVHLGFADVLGAGWRWAGFPVRRLFRAPLRSRSLTDFWSRRWNVAYVELNVVCVLPLLRPVLGRWARPAAFALSGVLHELAISLPVRQGYGGPLAYFVLHAVLSGAERRFGVDRWPGWAARTWTWAGLLLPLPLLFHGAFRDALVLPLFDRR